MIQLPSGARDEEDTSTEGVRRRDDDETVDDRPEVVDPEMNVEGEWEREEDCGRGDEEHSDTLETDDEGEEEGESEEEEEVEEEGRNRVTRDGETRGESESVSLVV